MKMLEAFFVIEIRVSRFNFQHLFSYTKKQLITCVCVFLYIFAITLLSPSLSFNNRFTIRFKKKNRFSYATLICMAMRANNNKMTLAAIYNWIKENFMYYRNADPSWQVSLNKLIKIKTSIGKIQSFQNRYKSLK